MSGGKSMKIVGTAFAGIALIMGSLTDNDAGLMLAGIGLVVAVIGMTLE